MTRIESEALVVRTIEYGESDAILTLLTETNGKLGVLVRGARKSTKRFGGALEPFHTLAVAIDDKGGDLGVLREARLVTMRHRLVASLDTLDAAGTALRWARHLFPVRTREEEGWAVLIELLDALDAGAVAPRMALAGASLRLLTTVGYALDLAQCVRCGRACPPLKPACIDAARGGLVCRECGGARRILSPELRAIAVALQRGEETPLSGPQAEELLDLTADAMAVHAGVDR